MPAFFRSLLAFVLVMLCAAPPVFARQRSIVEQAVQEILAAEPAWKRLDARDKALDAMTHDEQVELFARLLEVGGEPIAADGAIGLIKYGEHEPVHIATLARRVGGWSTTSQLLVLDAVHETASLYESPWLTEYTAVIANALNAIVSRLGPVLPPDSPAAMAIDRGMQLEAAIDRQAGFQRVVEVLGAAPSSRGAWTVALTYFADSPEVRDLARTAFNNAAHIGDPARFAAAAVLISEDPAARDFVVAELRRIRVEYGDWTVDELRLASFKKQGRLSWERFARDVVMTSLTWTPLIDASSMDDELLLCSGVKNEVISQSARYAIMLHRPELSMRDDAKFADDDQRRWMRLVAVLKQPELRAQLAEISSIEDIEDADWKAASTLLDSNRLRKAIGVHATAPIPPYADRASGN